MVELGFQRLAQTAGVFLLVGLFGLADSTSAGTGRLLSPWVNRAPRIDGLLTPGEWNAAKLVDLGSGVLLLIENDARTLYIALLDPLDSTFGNGDELWLHFDDEGGAAPVLDDSAWGNSACLGLADSGEGTLQFLGNQTVAYTEYAQDSACPGPLSIASPSFSTALRPEGLTYELAIPLDGPAPLQAGPGRRFGIELQVIRNGFFGPCLACAGSYPPDLRNLILASGGCNTGVQDFGAGSPQIGLPLDWTSENTIGGGPGWVQSLPPFWGDGVFCQSNDTGGGGAAACVSNFSCTQPRTDSLLRMPLALEGATTATVRARALLWPGGPVEYLEIGIRRQDASGNSLLFWLDENRNETVDLWIPVAGSPPVELWFTHSTFSAGGTEGGYAQIDEVELRCGPHLFADGFESGLTTHWSADVP